ncbi:hypothetical protein DU500_07580 [Haloplanus rubicundus]|uniref:Uncharacterized protein n=1 Tax=Haloplanus rubicundus TaxID=1547898 RepID=A0A345E285_9EURY|nr:hypothetical protein [Haloplanus rubicundus]AXG06307.1 hypothetical protein DU500_07580 [Haloplanus rubicundus]
MSIQTTRLETGDTDVRIHVLEQVDKTTVRIKVVADRCWRLEVDLLTEEIDILASYNAAGDLADVPFPDWIDAVTDHLERL